MFFLNSVSNKRMIRIAKQEDLQAILAIYNEAIDSRISTADTEHVNIADRAEWFAKHSPNIYPIYVWEAEGKVVAWVSISPYREGRKALQYTVEISYYVAKSHWGQGIASKLVEQMLAKAIELGYKSVFAIILEKNIASINLLKKFGFTQWALLPNVAEFDGEECGQVYLGKRVG